ncbi:MAG: ribonuclease H-like domain-containing protein [Lachnospiraceae bacterium]|nr:ribonuclease H-like domain-containing protein [Lachnospiraceae bacterium]
MKKNDNLLCSISNKSYYEKLTEGKGIFLDIETTGLKKDICSVYLIGLLYPEYKDPVRSYRLSLLFSEDPSEESLILNELFKILENTDFRAITFNGRHFDLPFLRKRYEIHGLKIPEALQNGTDIDIYAELRPCRRSFGLSHLDQKSIEKMLDIKREDRYSGKELIDVYKEYVITKDPALYDLLITHNRDDVLGMAEILPVLSYPEIFKRASDPAPGSFDIKSIDVESHRGFDGEENSELMISFTLPVSVPKPRLFHNYRLFLETFDNEGVLRIPLTQGELKHFFENYKDYCYIPSEDKAVLKEIASIMTTAETEKAKASNCYIKTKGLFLPLPEGFSFPDGTVYRQDYKSKTEYILYSEDIKKSPALEEYLLQVLGKCFR